MSGKGQTTLHRDTQGREYIVVYADDTRGATCGSKKRVYRKMTYSQRKKCRHEWHAVAWDSLGHGKWRSGCIKCGSLAR